MGSDMSLLVVQGFAGGYGEVDIVSGIDMRAAAREIVTIAGTNGAGKSTWSSRDGPLAAHGRRAG